MMMIIIGITMGITTAIITIDALDGAAASTSAHIPVGRFA